MVFHENKPHDPAYTMAWAAAGLGALMLLGSFLFGPTLSHWAANTGVASPGVSDALPLIPSSAFAVIHEPLVIDRIEEVGSAMVKASTGGQIDAGGVSITVPAGAFSHDRELSIYRIQPPPCPFSISEPGSSEPHEPQVIGAWEVDVGDESGLFPGEVEVAINLATLGAVDAPVLIPAISLDGATWTELPFERRGDMLVLRTRHFCPVVIWGIVKAVALGATIGTAVHFGIKQYYGPQQNLPDPLEVYKPFRRLSLDPEGFEIWWSNKLPGVDPDTGLLRTSFSDFKVGVEAIVKRHMAAIGTQDPDPQSWPPEVRKRAEQELGKFIKKCTVPDRVRLLEDALVFAQTYLESRGFDRPFFDLPVYVVPSLGTGSAGEINNPWLGRRFLTVGIDASEGAMYTTALHELFHHYQTGYVSVDRHGHLPLMEASALLMEREAEAHYLAASKPYDKLEGLVLAQVLSFAHGLEGPSSRAESPTKKFGYGLSWYLEYLRGWWPGGTDAEFHHELLKYWGSTTFSANTKAFLWAAGGDQKKLSRSFLDFSRDKILSGLEEGAGTRTPYGKKYGASIFEDSPYSPSITGGGALKGTYGLTPTVMDFSASPRVEIGDDQIRPWSIQFYKMSPPGRADAALVVRAPRSWFPENSPGRELFLRGKKSEFNVETLSEANLAPESCDFLATSLPFTADAFAYFVDTGQTGSGWFSGYDSAIFSLLEPPTDVEINTNGETATVTWKAPPSDSQISNYRIYADGQPIYAAEVKGSERSAEIFFVGSTPKVWVVSTVEICRDEEGEAFVIESVKSDVAGGEEPATYEMTISVDAGMDSIQGTCGAMYHEWKFEDFIVTVPVRVDATGNFNFSHQWNAEARYPAPSQFSLIGSGTFNDDILHIDARFSTGCSWTKDMHTDEPNTYYAEVQGAFVGEGKFIGGIWFGGRASGGYDATVNYRICVAATGEVCNEWDQGSTECHGEIKGILNSIDDFKRIAH